MNKNFENVEKHFNDAIDKCVEEVFLLTEIFAIQTLMVGKQIAQIGGTIDVNKPLIEALPPIAKGYLLVKKLMQVT